MPERFSWKDALGRARDNIKRKLHQNRKFLFVLKVVSDGRRGSALSGEPRRPESVGMPPTDTGEQNTALVEPPHSDKTHADKALPGKNPCVNKFLTNDPLVDKLPREQSLKEKPISNESGPEGSLARERRAGTPSMEPMPNETSLGGLPSEESPSGQSSLEDSVSKESVPEESAADESVSEESNPEESNPEDSVPEDSFTEHIEYADQGLHASSSAEPSIMVSGNSIPVPIPTMEIPPLNTLSYHPLDTPENNRLLRLPLELRLLIYDELLALPRTISLLCPQKERHPLASIRRIDKQLFSRRALQRYRFSAPMIGYYDPDTTTFAARFTDDEVCTHRQWGSEHLGAITSFAAVRQALAMRRLCELAHRSLNPQAAPQQQQQQLQNQAQAQAQAQQNPNQDQTHQAPSQSQPQRARTSAHGNANANTDASASASAAPRTYIAALLCAICSPHARRSNLLTWQRVHRELIQSHYTDPFVPPSFFSSTSAERPLIRVLELRFPRICSAINVLKSLMLGRVAGWRELRRLSVLRIRVCSAAAAAASGGGGGGVIEGAMGPLNEVDMVVLYSLAVTLSEEMGRKVALRRGPRIEIAW